jgi:hypothetical protein
MGFIVSVVFSLKTPLQVYILLSIMITADSGVHFCFWELKTDLPIPSHCDRWHIILLPGKKVMQSETILTDIVVFRYVSKCT